MAQKTVELSTSHSLWYESSTELSQLFFFCFTGSRNGVVIDIYWNMRGPIVRQLCVGRKREIMRKLTNF